MPPATIQIRNASVEDAHSIATLLESAFTEFKPLYTIQAFQATTPTADQIRDRLQEGPTWIAIQQSEIVGTVSCLPEKGLLYIRSMAVSVAARKLGIARRLLQLVENYASENGFKTLTLYTTPFLKDAIHLYERSGFHFLNEGGSADLFGTPLLKMVKDCYG